MCACDGITIPIGSKGDKGDTGATGPQGPAGSTGSTGSTGATGAAGTNGQNAYVYIAYADDNTGTGFTTTFNVTKDYIAIKSSTTVLTPLVADFAGLWKNYKGATGSTGATGTKGDQGDQGIQGLTGATGAAGTNGTNGAGVDTTFGIVDPSGTPATNPALYYNTSTYDVWEYTGSWVKIIQGFGPWQSVTTYNTADDWDDHTDSNFVLQFRKEGKTVRIRGKCYQTSGAADVIVAQDVFTLPSGYRPAYAIYQTGVDLSTGGTIPILEVQTSGDVVVRGDLTPFDNENCYFNFTFSTT